jgi:hypothetical protein
MKIAVINFSGNVGKTTVARHLLVPRMPAGTELISVESINAEPGQGLGQAMRGHQFGELQEYMQTVDHMVVDIGASNVEDLMALMRRYQGSHDDFDCFVVPTVSELKQQEDTIATLVDLARVGIAPQRLRLLFNRVEAGDDVARSFEHLLAFLDERPLAMVSPRCRLGMNEVYERIAGKGLDLATVARDDADYKALIAQASRTEDKLALAQKLATRRLARGVLPELDACFVALALGEMHATSDQDGCAEAVA